MITTVRVIYSSIDSSVSFFYPLRPRKGPFW
ncbi:hypothetical protein MPC1_7160004 [Methylocella tundrae]|nr:hypothetical protein MPC1_7160004 [Methylocella tundrae]